MLGIKYQNQVSPPPANQFMCFLKLLYVQESHKVRSQHGSNYNPISHLRKGKLALETEKRINDYQRTDVKANPLYLLR